MRFVLALIASLAVSACQPSESSERASFCDRLIGWEVVDAKTKRAVSRPEICALSQPDALWFRSQQVSTKLTGRDFWLLVPPNDPHLKGNAVSGWDLQVRPYGFAHEFFLVRNAGARLQPAIAQDACPRKAVGLGGIEGGKTYCLTN
ncbi:hypothetical protein [uncultured Aliiroseovarius sp.]|uniref:hypothetical protein n=1 Tax=uncultured Aliiroseovarius sp. TaxID=1658783 RepID=UPI002616490E|nr:hypothetical protein [uncultured Aliiroseovarius sp.]